MYYVLYDKDFQAIGRRKTYPCSKWTLKKRAYGFDELTVEGVAIESIEGATYVGLHENQGRLKAFAFSGIPKTEKGMTRIDAIDIRQVLNNEAIIDLTQSSIESVEALYVYLLSVLFDQHDALGIDVIIDTSELASDPIPFNEEALQRSRAIGNIYDTLQAVNAIYDCHIECIVNFHDHNFTFKVRRISQHIDIKLNDFLTPRIKNDRTGINRAMCMNEAYLNGSQGQVSTYYLTRDNRVISAADALLEVNQPFVIYPANIRCFVDPDFVQAKAKGIEALYRNRFQSLVEIDLSHQMGYILKDVGLNHMGNIYGYHEDLETYQELPVMEIYEDSHGNKTMTFGRLEEYWWA